MRITEHTLIHTFGNPIIERCSSGWCVGNPRWEAANLEDVILPGGWLDVLYDGIAVRVHERIAYSMYEVINQVYIACPQYTVTEIYGYSPRCKMGDPNRPLSMHAFGLAVDVNWSRNPLGGECADFPSAFIDAFQETGFEWGGSWGIRDLHHFELARDRLERLIIDIEEERKGE